MMFRNHRFFPALGLTLAALSPVGLTSPERNRYAQTVFNFNRQIPYDYYYDAEVPSLTIRFSKVSAPDLASSHTYDESLIRRVLITEKGHAGATITFVLRDVNVRATVTHFEEPYRVVVDFFDRYFRQNRDPQTGIPLIGQTELQKPNDISKEATIDSARRSQKYEQTIHDRLASTKSQNEHQSPTKLPLLENKKRRLLQPDIPSLYNSDELRLALSKIPPGIGQGWGQLPLYMYRIQTALYTIGKNYDDWLAKNTDLHLGSGRAMADYANKLYDFGHEGRALIVYQQILHKNPAIFDRDPIPLWKLAETHFGQNNLTLAEGYYRSLLDKHPDSPLSQFAKIRILDIKILNKRRTKNTDYEPIVAQLNQIQHLNQPELEGLINMRKAYWDISDTEELLSLSRNRFQLPRIDEKKLSLLQKSENSAKSQKTIFILSSLILNKLVDKENTWTKDTGIYADSYFKKYSQQSAEPIRSRLIEKTRNLLINLILRLKNENRFGDIISTYQNLPESLSVITDHRNISWAIAESYRLMANAEKAYPFYLKALNSSQTSPDIFKASLRASLMASAVISVASFTDQNPALAKKLKTVISDTDRKMFQAWDDLGSAEKVAIFAEIKEELEESVKSSHKLRTPATITLEIWSNSLNTNMASTANESDLGKILSPSANTIHLIQRLATKFSMLGMKKEKLKALDLLRTIKPSDFNNDKKASEVWASKLVELAEEYRRSNQYLNAGRAYALVGKESVDWDHRAEALYKGGLLLFRAGRSQEAIQAFREASQDKNNLLYAELAQRRLEKIEN